MSFSIGGYPKMSTFGTVVGERSAAGRDEYLRYHTAAVEVPNSPAIARLETIAKETNVFLVGGVIERDKGTLYCTAVFVSPQGYVTKHRKLVPTASERLIWGQGRIQVLFIVHLTTNTHIRSKVTGALFQWLSRGLQEQKVQRMVLWKLWFLRQYAGENLHNSLWGTQD
jgi:hypothetical protein